MLAPLTRRGLLRPRALATLTFALALIYLLFFRTPGSGPSQTPKLQVNHKHEPVFVPESHLDTAPLNLEDDHNAAVVQNAGPTESGKAGSTSEQGSDKDGDQSGPSNPGQGKQGSKAWENSSVRQDSDVGKMSDEEMKKNYMAEYKALADRPDFGAIYGNTLATLDFKKLGHLNNEAHLTPAGKNTLYSADRPYVYNPYPDYNGPSWRKENAPLVPCDGPEGKPLDDVQVFRGHPHTFPEPGFGSYEALGLDGNLCFERETRLGPYGLASNFTTEQQAEEDARKWESTHWGQLQDACALKNKARFDLKGQENPYVQELHRKRDAPEGETGGRAKFSFRRGHLAGNKRSSQQRYRLHTRQSEEPSGFKKEERTALLLRSYTGKDYSENDKQVIRSLITELSLRTGGRYQVYLFVHVKDASYAIWDDATTYQYVLQSSVPKEFRDITILWNDEATQAMYTALDPKQATVHVSQWLSVQKFAQEFPEFDYVWNWEMDARVTGHNYDIIEKLASFAKKQPRRGLWERNERFYIPAVHGKYDTDFRKEVEQRSQNIGIWGAPDLPFVKPLGPHPPTALPEDDDYQWGVGEEADLITLSPIFNPEKSGWVSVNELWGYNDTDHATADLPRRATIITHSRVSKKLLDIMHVENLRGNHISSEMATQTTAFLHGLKAVYAPLPVWFDRGWSGKDLDRWFNPGPNGTAGGHGCAMAWGQEGRYSGSTWYFRADPPQHLYLNWMGWEDTDIGGPEWEEEHGRPCLPPMIIHPVKDIEPTEPGYKSESKLPYD